MFCGVFDLNRNSNGRLTHGPMWATHCTQKLQNKNSYNKVESACMEALLSSLYYLFTP